MLQEKSLEENVYLIVIIKNVELMVVLVLVEIVSLFMEKDMCVDLIKNVMILVVRMKIL